jgi:uncharacterized protein YdhG (YjbR/CyaY superfamily)
MAIKPTTVIDYISQLPEERKNIIEKLRNIFLNNLPEGFEECLSYGMIGYVVPHKIYPTGYHCDPKLPLPFISIASQKNHITIYHMGMYQGSILDWWNNEWKKISTKKADLGKGCIRFKNEKEIPYSLIESLAKKMTPKDWISLYENEIKR